MDKLVKAIAICIQTHVPVLLWGNAGVGKSSTLAGLAVKLALAIEIVIASLREPADFAGLPIIEKEDVKLAPPSWAKRLKESEKGILFLDEITTAPPAVQAALLRVVLDGVVGDLKLPEAISVVGAANPPEIAANGYDLAPPMANRFIHLDWELDPIQWANGMENGWDTSYEEVEILPPNWEEEITVAKKLIADFIRKLPNLLYQYPKEETLAGKAWASPRSWNFAATLLAACRAAKVSNEITTILIKGAVGEAPAISFMGWLSELDLPDPEDLLSSGTFKFEKFKGRHDKVQVVLQSILAALKRNNTVERYYHSLKLCCQAGENGFKDIAFPIVRLVQQVKPVGAVETISGMHIFGEIYQTVKQS